MFVMPGPIAHPIRTCLIKKDYQHPHSEQTQNKKTFPILNESIIRKITEMIMKHLLKKFTATLLLFACLQKVNAAIVDTVDTYSPSMKKTIKAVVITPDNYANATALPVVYLLNGYIGNYRSW